MSYAFNYFKKGDKEHFAMSESSYPFNSGNDPDKVNKCNYGPLKATNLLIKTHDFLGFFGEIDSSSKMKAALKKHPLSVAIAANN